MGIPGLSKKYEKYVYMPKLKGIPIDLIWPLNFIAYIKHSNYGKFPLTINQIKKVVNYYSEDGYIDPKVINQLDAGIKFVFKHYLGNQDTVINKFKLHRSDGSILKEYNYDTTFTINEDSLYREINKTVKEIKESTMLYRFVTEGYAAGREFICCHKEILYKAEENQLTGKYDKQSLTKGYICRVANFKGQLTRAEKLLAALENREPDYNIANKKNYYSYFDPIKEIQKDIVDINAKINQYDPYWIIPEAKYKLKKIEEERKRNKEEEEEHNKKEQFIIEQAQLEEKYSRLIEPHYYKRTEDNKIKYFMSEFTETEVGGKRIYNALRKVGIKTVADLYMIDGNYLDDGFISGIDSDIIEWFERKITLTFGFGFIRNILWVNRNADKSLIRINSGVGFWKRSKLLARLGFFLNYAIIPEQNDSNVNFYIITSCIDEKTAISNRDKDYYEYCKKLSEQNGTFCILDKKYGNTVTYTDYKFLLYNDYCFYGDRTIEER